MSQTGGAKALFKSTMKKRGLAGHIICERWRSVSTSPDKRRPYELKALLEWFEATCKAHADTRFAYVTKGFYTASHLPSREGATTRLTYAIVDGLSHKPIPSIRADLRAILKPLKQLRGGSFAEVVQWASAYTPPVTNEVVSMSSEENASARAWSVEGKGNGASRSKL